MAETGVADLEVLERDECLRLLEPGGVCRLAWFDGSRPVVRPLNFALDGVRIVMRTGEGQVLAAAHQRLLVTLEVDDIRTLDHSAWSVIVDGSIASASASEAERLPLRPWAPGARDHFVQVAIAAISGRRFGPAR